MLAASLLVLSLTLSSPTPQEPGASLGTVNFQTSCSAKGTDDFNHAVALLYSFEYEEAHDEFVAISKKEPQCAMARWGEAMTYFHGLWGEYNPAEGSKASAEARAIAASNPTTTAEEKAFIAAISELFSPAAIKDAERPDNKPNEQGYMEPSHAAEVAYKDKMKELHLAFPSDDEATVLYALALNIAATPTDKAHPLLHECTALLNPLFKKHPTHPGIAHYLIHCNDNPEMAKDGLEAARQYAQIAPASAHATHMPSHIFAQLGLWDEMIASNRTSLHAAEADHRASPCQKVGNTLHAMYYLMFALLQEGKVHEAQSVLAQAAKVTSEVPGGEKCDDDDSLLVAGYTMETGDWARAKNISFHADANKLVSGVTWMAKGIGSARTNNLAVAKTAEAQLTEARDMEAKHAHQAGSDSRPEAFRLAVAAWIAQASGDSSEGLKLIREAADMQDRLGGSPSVFKPLREMFADMCLLDGKNEEALKAYSAVLATHPNRFDTLYGAGSAAYALGEAGKARDYYSQLVKFANGEERPELQTARKRLKTQAGD